MLRIDNKIPSSIEREFCELVSIFGANFNVIVFWNNNAHIQLQCMQPTGATALFTKQSHKALEISCSRRIITNTHTQLPINCYPSGFCGAACNVYWNAETVSNASQSIIKLADAFSYVHITHTANAALSVHIWLWWKDGRHFIERESVSLVRFIIESSIHAGNNVCTICLCYVWCYIFDIASGNFSPIPPFKWENVIETTIILCDLCVHFCFWDCNLIRFKTQFNILSNNNRRLSPPLPLTPIDSTINSTMLLSFSPRIIHTNFHSNINIW